MANIYDYYEEVKKAEKEKIVFVNCDGCGLPTSLYEVSKFSVDISTSVGLTPNTVIQPYYYCRRNYGRCEQIVRDRINEPERIRRRNRQLQSTILTSLIVIAIIAAIITIVFIVITNAPPAATPSPSP